MTFLNNFHRLLKRYFPLRTLQSHDSSFSIGKFWATNIFLRDKLALLHRHANFRNQIHPQNNCLLIFCTLIHWMPIFHSIKNPIFFFRTIKILNIFHILHTAHLDQCMCARKLSYKFNSNDKNQMRIQENNKKTEKSATHKGLLFLFPSRRHRPILLIVIHNIITRASTHKRISCDIYIFSAHCLCLSVRTIRIRIWI